MMAINWNVEKYKATYIAQLIDKKTIKVPHYQRGQVWKKEQKETLIDSIKKGYPFGSILLFEMEDKTYQLIDGLQRVSTIYEYLHNPASFFNKSDIKKESIDQIYKLLNLKGNEDKVKDQLLNVIQEWVTEKHKTMEDVKNMQFIDCARYIDEKFSLETSENTFKVTEILSSDLSAFRDNCDLLTSIEIPVIIYEGDSDNLSEVFNRINSKGTTLSKYQILSATWSDNEYKLESKELDPIIDYVDRFYLSISDVHFGIEGYDRNSVIETRRLNLYQIVYGFGKLLSNKFPYLFKQSKNEQIDSCGFNLINSCIGNKNSKMSKLPKIINSTFKNDIEFSEFLVNIIDTTDIVYSKLKPYLEFKLNKRKSKIEIYHSEFQICSMIANYFNAKYSTYEYDDNNNIINREINTIEINDSSFALRFPTEFRQY